MTTQITTTTVSQFTLHDLSEAQFSDLSTINQDDLYLTPDNSVTSDDITTIVKCTQSEYEAITTKDANTFYVVVADPVSNNS